MYGFILLMHLLAATIWTGGHLVLALTVLPQALRERSTETIVRFERGYERIGIPALLVQVASGFWLAHRLLPDVTAWFQWEHPLGRLILFKLGLLVATMALAIDARLRIIPRLQPSDLRALAWHIVPVTVLSVLFVVVGVAFRTGWFTG